MLSCVMFDMITVAPGAAKKVEFRFLNSISGLCYHRGSTLQSKCYLNDGVPITQGHHQNCIVVSAICLVVHLLLIGDGIVHLAESLIKQQKIALLR